MMERPICVSRGDSNYRGAQLIVCRQARARARESGSCHEQEVALFLGRKERVSSVSTFAEQAKENPFLERKVKGQYTMELACSPGGNLFPLTSPFILSLGPLNPLASCALLSGPPITLPACFGT